MTKLHKQIGPGCLVCGLQLPRRRPKLLDHQRELDLWVVELFGVLPLAKLSWDGGCLDNLNARKPNPVARSHLSVHLFHSPIQSGITVFLVHIVVTCSALIPQPYPIVVDFGWVLFKYLQEITKTHAQKS